MKKLLMVAGAALGALLVLGLVIAYDTSASVAAFEGGRRHLPFVPIVVVTLFGAAVGAGVGAWLAGELLELELHGSRRA